MRKYLIAFVLFTSSCMAGMGTGGVPYPGPGQLIYSYDYCVRADGTATKDNATSCVSPSTAMSTSTARTSTFSPGDKVAFSDRGGDLDYFDVPSGGDVDNIIEYFGEVSHAPNFTGYQGIKVAKSNVTIKDFTVSGGANSSFEFGDGTNIYTGIITNNLKAYNSTNQSFQHLDGVTVTHYNLYSEGAADEGVSLHNDNPGVDDPNVTIYGIALVANKNGLNWVGSPTLSVYDFTITPSSDATGKSIDGATVLGGTYIFERGTVTEHIDQNQRTIDCPNGNWTFKNVIFKNLTDADYYLLARSTLSGFKLINCTFKGDGINSTTAIFNQYAGSYINNVFDDVITNGFYGTAGTVSNNLFNNSGTTNRGTNPVVGNPYLASDGKLTSSSTIVFDAGIGPSSNALVPTEDIDKEVRSGTTTDIGADQY